MADAEGEPSRGINENLAKSRIAPDLRDQIAERSKALLAQLDVIIDFNTAFPGGARVARQILLQAYLWTDAVPMDVRSAQVGRLSPGTFTLDGQGPAIRLLSGDQPFAFQPSDRIDVWKSLQTESFAFAQLSLASISMLSGIGVVVSASGDSRQLIHKLWRDHPIEAYVYESVRTIKCDAARAAFGSAGRDIVWAVADTGVDGSHPHFHTHSTLALPDGLRHCDFTESYSDANLAEAAALSDVAGHGSHVAGIIAGATYTAGSASLQSGLPTVPQITVSQTVRTDDDQTQQITITNRTEVCGIAPLCKIVSLKVLTDARSGLVSNLLAAIGYIQQVNNYGRDIKIHGLNLSLGYPFNAAWFAAGQSPLCVEVDRLVRCGVSVVVAAGNAGYGRVSTSTGTSEVAALTCTIADPGNAELAITVGSTHRDKPHVFGVSYFSAKGPTADGRMKPDLVAPGERIVSCAAPSQGGANYKEDSGTSMAAPHVSAAVAAFLSVRHEFIGRPSDVKEILVSAAMPLKRRPEFQGAGLVDLMKALQSV